MRVRKPFIYYQLPYAGNIWRGKILANTGFLNFWMVKYIGELTFASYFDGKTKTFGG